MKILFFFLSTCLLALGVPVQTENLANRVLTKYFNSNPRIYNDLINLMSQNVELIQYIYLDNYGNKIIDFDSFFGASGLEQITSQNVHRKRRQIDFNNFSQSLLNVFNTFSLSLQNSLQNSLQQLISITINDIFNRLQSSLLSGQPADLNDIMTNFLANLKRILTNNILETANETFKQQALNTLNLQFNELYSLVEKLKKNSLAPIQFVDLLHKSLENLQRSLSIFLPNISDLIMSQLISLLEQIMKK